ncbi:MAG TPA: peptidyl-prolyl cis-trans isomerase [Phaeodactylibacter sp.]|nr:peptidyl-prolyl cis-trans isomerase [Phaeodactylibacter sp.]
MMNHRFALSFFAGAIFTLLFALACNRGADATQPESKVLAQVHNSVLYLSDMEGMFPEQCTAKDSAMIIHGFVDNWVRDKVLMYEAENNLPKNINIDKLVSDYRASLIRHNFEKNMVEILLDSTVTDTQLFDYYQQNKEQYKLSSPILRCRLLKVDKEKVDIEKLKKLWKSNSEEDFLALLDFASKQAELYLLEDSLWYKKEDIILRLPKGTLNGKLSIGKDLQLNEDGFIYFFKLNDIIKKGKPAPLSFVKEQINKVILHQRKKAILKEKTEEMYERALRKKQINIFPIDNLQ